MENSQKAAFPYFADFGGDDKGHEIGLTKREYFAIRAMQSMISSVYSGNAAQWESTKKGWIKMYGEEITIKEAISRDSIGLADELLNQLNLTTP